MADGRLSALDASFLDVESPTAHMHVGWAATFDRPRGGPAPDFAYLRDHIASRLDRAPRYRQRLAGVPLDAHHPVWTDDADFAPDRHIRRASETDLGDVVTSAMSAPLARDRPLWEMSIADNLADGTIGLVGKAHHCMVDGIAAVELASLLLDPSSELPAALPARWSPAPAPGRLGLLAPAVAERARQGIDIAGWPLRVATSPGRAIETARAALTLAGSLLPPAPPSPLNRAGSPARHLGTARRPLSDLRRVKRAYDGATVNDVLLAAAAGALRRFMLARGGEVVRLKTMVPVNVRAGGEAFGNRIAFVFVELPCHLPDPLARLAAISADMRRRKRSGEPQRSDALLQAAGYAPRTLQRLIARVAASAHVSNLVVSNIPGPRETLFMAGCRLREAYPIVPLADDHALSIGMTTVGDDACFGLYADRRTLPDVGALAAALDESVDEMLEAVP